MLVQLRYKGGDKTNPVLVNGQITEYRYYYQDDRRKGNYNSYRLEVVYYNEIKSSGMRKKEENDDDENANPEPV